MTPRVMNAAAGSSSARGTQSITRGSSNAVQAPIDFATIGRAPLRLGLGRRVTSQDLQILESTGELLASDVPDSEPSDVSLLRGFNATIPSSEKGKTRRRKIRNMEVEGELGLKKMGLEARGLLEDAPKDKGRKGKRRGRESLTAPKVLGRQELKLQKSEVMLDKENLAVRRVCCPIRFTMRL
jgi:mitochondrial division protein 1